MTVYFILKPWNHSIPFFLKLVVTSCHSLFHSLSFVVIPWTTQCHVLSFVVTRCHLLSLDVPLACRFINDLENSKELSLKLVLDSLLIRPSKHYPKTNIKIRFLAFLITTLLLIRRTTLLQYEFVFRPIFKDEFSHVCLLLKNRLLYRFS